MSMSIRAAHDIKILCTNKIGIMRMGFTDSFFSLLTDAANNRTLFKKSLTHDLQNLIYLFRWQICKSDLMKRSCRNDSFDWFLLTCLPFSRVTENWDDLLARWTIAIICNNTSYKALHHSQKNIQRGIFFFGKIHCF